MLIYGFIPAKLAVYGGKIVLLVKLLAKKKNFYISNSFLITIYLR